MSTTSAGLMTVAEFMRLPDPSSGSRHELHHGEVVEMPPPSVRHAKIQDRLVVALKAFATSDWVVRVELPFRPQIEYEVWIADVAALEVQRWDQADLDGVYPLGSPPLVIEVLSPSNTVIELLDRQTTCLANGCQEFWVVNPKSLQIQVNTPDGRSRTYTTGHRIEVRLLGGTVAVDDILA